MAAIHETSLAWMIVGGLVAGAGQGIAFRAGMGDITQASLSQRRAEVASSFFVVAYVAISIPVVGLGLAATWLGLSSAGLLFAGLALMSMAILAWQRARTPRP